MIDLSKLNSYIKEDFGDEVAISNRIAQEESLLHVLSVTSLMANFVDLVEKLTFNDETPVLSVIDGHSSNFDSVSFEFNFRDPLGFIIYSKAENLDKIYLDNKEVISDINKLLKPIQGAIDSLCINWGNGPKVLNINLTKDKEKNNQILLQNLLAIDQLAFIEKLTLDKELSVEAVSKPPKNKI